MGRGVNEEDRILDKRPIHEPIVDEERPLLSGLALWLIAFAVAALFLTSLMM
jgi:hypothetical protein